LILTGLLSSEERVRVDFQQSLSVIARSVNEGDNNALFLVLGILAKNFSTISNKPSRQYFVLFDQLIDLKALRDEIAGDSAADSNEIYNPEDLLNQIIDKIKQQQSLKQDLGADSASPEIDEVRALELAAE